MLKKNQILIVVFIAFFVLLYLRLVELQISEKGNYAELAAQNAAKTIPERAPRGVIYDRNGKVLIESRPIFSVQVLPTALTNASREERERILNALGALLGEKIDFKFTASEPIIIKENIPFETAIRIEERKRGLEGVVVTSQPIRLYKYGAVAAHVLGYVGEIQADELERTKGEGYRMRDLIGKDGVERIYDKQSRGVDGGKKIDVDVHGTPTRRLANLGPVPGADMKLTIDLDLQIAAEKALGNKEGAVVVLDPRSGEVLAMASYPNYDPNIFTDPMERSKWKELTDRRHPFINRALAIYPPGSIFKVVTLAAALGEGKAALQELIFCPGYYRLNNRIAKCWLASGHGSVTPIEGLVWSCDIMFYELGRRLGPDLIAKYAQKYGLGSRTNIDLPQEKKGTVPTKEWKEKTLKEPWYEGDSINYGIGQGFLQVTPLQMASVYAGIASGKILKPFIVSEIRDRAGSLIYQGKREEVGDVPLSSENLALMRNALRDVVKRGTGVAARVQGIPAAGKTGTAENPGKAHAWFICYAPYDDPEIVIASFVAHGEHGDRASAYIARDILKWYKQYRLTKVYSDEALSPQYIQHGENRSYLRPSPAPKPSAESEVL